MLSWIVWLEMAAAVSGLVTSPRSKASYASATASAGTPMSGDSGEGGDAGVLGGDGRVCLLR